MKIRPAVFNNRRKLVSFLTYLICTFTLSVSGAVMAKKGDFYTTLSAGYAYNDIYQENIDEIAYKFSLAYELSDQWVIEGSAHMLAASEVDADDLNGEFTSLETDIFALQISALGRASNRHGQLYYRLGLAHVIPDSIYTTTAELCLDDDEVLSSADGNLSCTDSEGIWAGVLGIGFDMFVYRNTLVRFEVEHIQGKDDFTSQAIYLGIRYNF